MRHARLIPWLALVALAGAGEPAALPETAAYVGIDTSAAPPVLREQLGLPRGVGVVIDFVEPDSPAHHAGLAVHDVVTRLDDQLVVNVQQFGVLVRLHHGGETVTLHAIRDGKAVTVPVVLAERAVPEVAAVVPHGGRLSSVVTRVDGEHLITLITHGEADRHVRIADRAGHVVYDGPFNTPEDAAGLPPECRAKVEAIQRDFESYKRAHATTTPSR